MAPYLEMQTLWAEKARNRIFENRYCSRCHRTEKFQRADDLTCLTCGKKLQCRRSG